MTKRTENSKSELEKLFKLVTELNERVDSLVNKASKVEKPIENKESWVQTSSSYPDYYSFKTECACFSHDIKVRFEYEKEPDQPTLTINDTLYINECMYGNINDPWYKKAWTRIKLACKCLFGNGFDVDYEFIFKNEDQVNQFVAMMSSGYARMVDFAEKKKAAETKPDEVKVDEASDQDK